MVLLSEFKFLAVRGFGDIPEEYFDHIVSMVGSTKFLEEAAVRQLWVASDWDDLREKLLVIKNLPNEKALLVVDQATEMVKLSRILITMAPMHNLTVCII